MKSVKDILNEGSVHIAGVAEYNAAKTRAHFKKFVRGLSKCMDDMLQDGERPGDFSKFNHKSDASRFNAVERNTSSLFRITIDIDNNSNIILRITYEQQVVEQVDIAALVYNAAKKYFGKEMTFTNDSQIKSAPTNDTLNKIKAIVKRYIK